MGLLWPSTGTGDVAGGLPAEEFVVTGGVVTDGLGVEVVVGTTELAATDDELSAGVVAPDTLLLAEHPASSRQDAMDTRLAGRDMSQKLPEDDRHGRRLMVTDVRQFVMS